MKSSITSQNASFTAPLKQKSECSSLIGSQVGAGTHNLSSARSDKQKSAITANFAGRPATNVAIKKGPTVTPHIISVLIDSMSTLVKNPVIKSEKACLKKFQCKHPESGTEFKVRLLFDSENSPQCTYRKDCLPECDQECRKPEHKPCGNLSLQNNRQNENGNIYCYQCVSEIPESRVKREKLSFSMNYSCNRQVQELSSLCSIGDCTWLCPFKNYPMHLSKTHNYRLSENNLEVWQEVHEDNMKEETLFSQPENSTDVTAPEPGPSVHDNFKTTAVTAKKNTLEKKPVADKKKKPSKKSHIKSEKTKTDTVQKLPEAEPAYSGSTSFDICSFIQNNWTNNKRSQSNDISNGRTDTFKIGEYTMSLRFSYIKKIGLKTRKFDNISLFFYFHREKDFEPVAKWPFTGNIVMLNDATDHKETIVVNSKVVAQYPESFNRPTKERAPYGYGSSEYIIGKEMQSILENKRPLKITLDVYPEAKQPTSYSD